MKKTFVVIFFLLIISSSSIAYAQQPHLASYRETAHILVDEKIQNQTTAFITLASTSPVEMRVPQALNEKISNTENLTSVVITNADKCILGVQDLGCIIINIANPSLIETYNITKIQSTAKKIGDTMIDDINKDFALNAEFNNVYINPKGDLSTSLGTSGTISGNKTISVVYTMPRPDSSYFYDGLTSILIPKQIRDDGGFYNAAVTMAKDVNSTVTFVITPGKGTLLYQLQVSKNIPIKTEPFEIKPLELFGVDKIERSKYYSVGFFPLNSILDVTVLSNNNISIINHGGNLSPTILKDGQKLPSDLTKEGWIIDPDAGQRISAVYIFGTSTMITNDQASLTLGRALAGQPEQNNTISKMPNVLSSTDYSLFALMGILAVGGAAVYIFMRRR